MAEYEVLSTGEDASEDKVYAVVRITFLVPDEEEPRVYDQDVMIPKVESERHAVLQPYADEYEAAVLAGLENTPEE